MYSFIWYRFLFQNDLSKSGNLTFPRVKSQAQVLHTIDTVKKENTRDPPKIMEWYVQALSSSMWISETAIAQGSIQRKFEPRAW